MEFETITLNRRRIATMTRISKDVIADLRFDVFENNEDNFLKSQLTAKLEADVLSSQCQTQKVYHYTEKPTFWDWFHGRRKKITIEIECNDLMLNPPKIDSARMYELKIERIEITNK